MAAWDEEAIAVLRAALDDLDEPFIYSDTKLLKLLVRAAILVMNDIHVDTYVVDITTATISPDPKELGDNSFINLLILKVGCLLDTSKVRKAADETADLQDATFRISTRYGVDAIVKLWQLGFCKAYEEAKFDYLAGSRMAGTAILSPFRIGGYFEPSRR
jgi:hypothetical protein